MFLKSVVFILLIITGVKGRDGFVKDQNVNLVEFPPKIKPSVDPVIPVGHLRPLGWQKAPEGMIDESKTSMNPTIFYNKFVKEEKPVVLREALQKLPAMDLWPQKNYLKNKYGNIMVEVVVKKEFLKTGATSMKLSKFMGDFLYDDLYLSNYLPHEMKSELALPGVLGCGLEEWLMESELWMSSGGTSSLLHSHSDHDLHCLLSGRKDFVFIESKFKPIFDYQEKEGLEGAGHSTIDMDMINMFKYKDISEVPWRWAILRPGDCVFVPAGLMHQVRSYGVSISVTNHFSPSPDIQLSQCDQVPEQRSLDHFNYLWTYKDGQLWLTEENLDSESTRRHLIKLMRQQKDLSKHLFKSFYETLMEKTPNAPKLDDVWAILTSNDVITREEVKQLPVTVLTSLADVLNLPKKQVKMVKEEL